MKYCPTRCGQQQRRGLTLLEVIVAMAIFLMALVPIMRLISLGTEHALDVSHRSEASMLCQSKMDSVKAGVEPLNGSGTVEIGTMTWNYSIESTPAGIENLYTVKVNVHVDRADGQTIEESLVQMVIDPSVRGSTISIAAAAAANASTTSSSSSSSTTGGN